MKKSLKYILCISIAIFINKDGYCDSKNRNNNSNLGVGQVILLGINYGMTNKFGFDLTVISEKGFIWGGGATIGLGHGGVGKDYSNTIGPNAFPNDIYEKTTNGSGSFYGILGYKLKNFVINSKIGSGTLRTYYNAYDKSQILSPNGYYFTSNSAENNILIGINLIYTGKKIMPNIGFDSYNGVCFGVNFKFL